MSAAGRTSYESFYESGYLREGVGLEGVLSVDRTFHAITLEFWASGPFPIFVITQLPPSSRIHLLAFRYFCVPA